MRRLRVVRVLLLGLALVTVSSLLYQFTASERGFSMYLQLKNSPLDSGVRMLHASWKELTGQENSNCESNQQLKTSGHQLETYKLGNKHLVEVARSLNLNLKQAWVSPSKSLFSLDEFKNISIPQFKARIPALVYHKGYFLVFCEARFDGVGDWGNMVISMRRGRLNGRQVIWERIRLIAGIPDHRTMNPAPIVDRRNDAIILVFSAFLTYLNFNDMLMYAGQPLSRVYVMKSYDVGQTWTNPEEITSSTIGKMHPFPVLYVPGPGHAIQMKCGRLVVPGNFFRLDKTGSGIMNVCGNCTNLSNIIYSDDGGTTWHLGAETGPGMDAGGVPIHPNEAQLAELDNNTLYLNARTLNGVQPRAYCYSHDGGQTLSTVQLHATLLEPGFRKSRAKTKTKWKQLGAGGCHGSVFAINVEGPARTATPFRSWLLFSNPTDPLERVNLGIRLSVDGGHSWSRPWIVYPYKSGYSDLTYFEANIDGKLERRVAVLFEGGSGRYTDHIKFQMFNLEALFRNILDYSRP